MAFKKKVYECDLCGEEFDDRFIKHISEYKTTRFIKRKSIDIKLNLSFNIYDFTRNDGCSSDLCPKCMLKELSILFKGIRSEFIPIGEMNQQMMFADEVERK